MQEALAHFGTRHFGKRHFGTDISSRVFFNMGTFRLHRYSGIGKFWHWDFSVWGLFGMCILRHGTLLHKYISALGYFGTMHKVIHPKYYKHLKKGAHQSHLGRQKMGWFLAH